MPRNAVGMSSGYDHRESQVSFRQIQVFRRHDNGQAELSVLGESIYMRPWCFQWTWRKTSQSDFNMSQPLRANIQRGNPEKVFDLIEKVGGGTYGDVFKVCLYIRFISRRASALLNFQYSRFALFDLEMLLTEMRPPFLGQGYFYRGTLCCKSCQSWTR